MKKCKFVLIPVVAIFLHILDRNKDLFLATVETSDGIFYSDVIVTASGPVRGKLVTDEDMEFRYYAYQGIPYAESPIGSLRFQPPVPKKPWKKLLNATVVRKSCFQYEIYNDNSEMSEDCLYLNIYVPENITSDTAVLIIIHGEGVLFRPLVQEPIHLGSHVFFVKNNIITVTINFRLGAFGYFCLNTEEATGNNQLKDILLALTWIKENIERFGGDINNITLISFSSGAAIIEYLMASDKSNGLFQQAVLLSGSILGSSTFGRYPKQSSLDLALQLDIEDDNPTDILEKMRKVNARDIVKADEAFIFNEDKLLLRTPSRFVPHAEINSTHAVLTESPKNLLERGKHNNIKILLGVMEEENFCFLPVANYFSIKQLNDDIELLVPNDIEYPKNSKKSKELAKLIHNFYFFRSNITVHNIRNLMLLNGDVQFTYPIRDLLDHYNKLHSNLYFYIFNFVNDFNVFSMTMNFNYTLMGHADPAYYIINSRKLRSKYKMNDLRTIKMSRKLLSLTSNFVKFGNPTPEGYDDGVKWPKYGEKNKFLEIGERMKVKSDLSEGMKRRIKFWQKVYNEYHQYIREGGTTEPKIIP